LARSTWVIFFLFFLFQQAAFSDVMNLNEFMPTRLEDSTPVNAHSFDVQVSSQFEEKSKDEITYRGNFRYGATDRIQLEAMTNMISGGGEEGSGETQLGGLFLVNKEDRYVPQIGVSPMIVLPTGKESRELDSHLRFNISSTLVGSANTPTTQIHFNFDWNHHTHDQKDQRRDAHFFAFGLSHRFSDSGALIIDLYRELEDEKDVETNMAEAGIHYEIGSNYYLGLGGGLGFGDESAHWHGLLSLEKEIY
jgi:hypothetical protein